MSVYPVISLVLKSVMAAIVSISMPEPSNFFAISNLVLSSPSCLPCCNPVLSAVSSFPNGAHVVLLLSFEQDLTD